MAFFGCFLRSLLGFLGGFLSRPNLLGNFPTFFTAGVAATASLHHVSSSISEPQRLDEGITIATSDVLKEKRLNLSANVLLLPLARTADADSGRDACATPPE